MLFSDKNLRPSLSESGAEDETMPSRPLQGTPASGRKSSPYHTIQIVHRLFDFAGVDGIAIILRNDLERFFPESKMHLEVHNFVGELGY
ncbi:hypothetical protein TNIN_287661 [Trichonephila inaurata madagascariensis]|uniref:Uncharacterized protein n=1 Tax=Trichonephila inaurata madagascariensis TaxID=2747483 RepID=A0A8X6X303_9ARAC|nr:hypothetical protein TNIN_287661 [Trichonephila inaurata madagascariensis]